MNTKKHFYLIVDTETTNQNLVADFGAVVLIVAVRFGLNLAHCLMTPIFTLR